MTDGSDAPVAGDDSHCQPATQRDVARLAGVSQSTVSAILAGRSRGAGISPRTEQRVLEIARSVNYRYDTAARRLKGKNNKLIGAHSYGDVFPLAPRNYNYEYLVGICIEAEAAGYDTVMFTSATRAGSEPRVYPHDENRLSVADGAVIFGYRDDRDELARLTREGYPFVRVTRRDVPGADIAWIDADVEGAAAQLVHAIADAGYSQPGYLGLTGGGGGALARRRGYLSAVERLGLPSGSIEVVTRQQSGDPLWFASLINGGVDVVLVEDHMLANNILQAGYTAGLRVNVDFAIAVLQAPFSDPYDGTFCGFLMEPKAEMGRHAARLLIELIEGREPAERQIILPCEPLLTITPTIRRPPKTPPTDGRNRPGAAPEIRATDRRSPPRSS